MKDRIIKIMEREGLTPSKFAETIGIQRSAMSHIISGRNNPSLDVLTKILERFNTVDSDWLLFGKGSMLRDYTSPVETDLFGNGAIIQPDSLPVTEYGQEMRVKIPESGIKNTIYQSVMPVEKPERTVSKIMIFYSDNTFDTFTPEKNKKD